MRFGRATGVALTVIVLVTLVDAARADAAPLCRPSTTGPWEYQATLGPLVSGFVLAPPAPGQPAPPPPASTGVGAANLARDALGAQFAGVWLSSTVQGWAAGLAPGPLDPAAAHAAIVERIAAHYTADEVALLYERLHVDPQPYGDADLRATQDDATATLRTEAPGTLWGASVGCSLSDARRVEVSVFQPATPEQFLRVIALLEPFGDKVRIELSDRGAPSPAVGVPRARPQSPATVAVGRHVTLPILRRCVRGRQVRIRARASQPPVRALTVRTGGRSRTISGRRLAKPLVVDLRGRRTKVVVTVRLADGRVGTKTVTYTRCR